jgi:hypothetical protein
MGEGCDPVARFDILSSFMASIELLEEGNESVVFERNSPKLDFTNVSALKQE